MLPRFHPTCSCRRESPSCDPLRSLAIYNTPEHVQWDSCRCPIRLCDYLLLPLFPTLIQTMFPALPLLGLSATTRLNLMFQLASFHPQFMRHIYSQSMYRLNAFYVLADKRSSPALPFYSLCQPLQFPWIMPAKHESSSLLFLSPVLSIDYPTIDLLLFDDAPSQHTVVLQPLVTACLFPSVFH